MGRRFNEDDEEYIELLKEYERYIRDTPGAYEDFDEWLEVEYGASKKKTHKHSSTKVYKVRDNK